MPECQPGRPPLGGLVFSLLLAFLLGSAKPAVAQVTFTDINPSQSTLHPSDPDGASGGRINGLAAVARDPNVFYAATEWGGIYKSTDRGRTWFRLDRHLPVATWDVEVSPRDPQRVVATSFYDGRVASQAGINVSSDAGATWSKPPSTLPPQGLCAADRREEPSAFGISIDPRNPNRVYVGTNCGLAISNDAGATWNYVDPTPNDPATNVWDVVAHHGQIVDLCGDDGHFRSVDAGATWTAGSGLPSGLCSIAASPHERDVVFAAVAQDAWETDNGGGGWVQLGTPDSRRQGRIPFVATNPRTVAGAQVNAFDLWYGDVRLYRAGCQSSPPGGGLRCPMATTGAVLPPMPPAGWAGPFTRSVGGHDDVGDIAFVPGSEVNACPALFSSDGGVYFNTRESSPDCHTPHMGPTECHAARAVALGIGRRQSARRTCRRPLFRQPGQWQLRHDQRRGRKPGLDEPGLLRRVRRQRRPFARALHDLLLRRRRAGDALASAQSRHGGRGGDQHLSARHPSGLPADRRAR